MNARRKRKASVESADGTIDRKTYIETKRLKAVECLKREHDGGYPTHTTSKKTISSLNIKPAHVLLAGEEGTAQSSSLTRSSRVETASMIAVANDEPVDNNEQLVSEDNTMDNLDGYDDADADLLMHLDNARKRELNLWNDQHDDHPTDPGTVLHLQTDDVCDRETMMPTEWLLPHWQDYLRNLRIANHGEKAKAIPRSGGEEPRTSTNEEFSDDLLKLLDIERRREQNRLDKRRVRARQTDNKHTDGYEIGQTENNSRDILFDNELSDHERQECMKKLQKALGPEGLEECVCAVCDRLVLCGDARRKNDTDWRYMKKMKTSLKVDHDDLPDGLVDYYRAPPHLAVLEKVMVSPRGIHCYIDETSTPRAWFMVCKECDRAIVQTNLPKFSIANGFFIGRLPPPLRKLTLPERFMTQLVSIVAMTRVLRGGRQRCIRSHCIAFDCTPGPPILLLPRSIEDVISYRVVMVGEFTCAQTEKVRKMHRIRRCNVQDVFTFYKTNNHLYSGVMRNEPQLVAGNTNDGVDHTFIEHLKDPSGEFDIAMDREQENVRGETDAWRVIEEDDESTVIERRMGLSDDEKPVMVREHPLANKVGAHDERKFEVRRSNVLVNDISGDLFGRMFPHLFPFGRGHSGEHRKAIVSVQECINNTQCFQNANLQKLNCLYWLPLTDLQCETCIFRITFAASDIRVI